MERGGFRRMVKKNSIRHLKVIFAFGLFCFCSLSELASKEVETILFKEKGELAQKWDKLFTDHTLINFTYKNQPLSGFGLLGINSKGDYFLFSPVEKKIMQFDKTGNFIRFIGSIGQGPGEYQGITNSFFDGADNLYLYDAPILAISIFTYPDYQFSKQIHLKSTANKIFINDEGHFITFSIFNVSNLLKKYDQSGRILGETFKPEDERLSLAMARFNRGGLANIPGTGFLFVYPDKYYIYLYDYNLTLKKIFKPSHFSKFYPKAESFPQDLAPNEFSFEHTKWWDKFLHPGDIFFFKDGFFLVTVCESKGRFGKNYINLHDLNGVTYARGLEIPHEGEINCIQGDYVYILEQERFIGQDEFVPTRLHRYRFSLPER
jgi:hypothetical protein